MEHTLKPIKVYLETVLKALLFKKKVVQDAKLENLQFSVIGTFWSSSVFHCAHDNFLATEL